MSKQCFPFFSLPRELRDQVYSYLTQNIKLASTRSSCAWASAVFIPYARLLCRSFTEEYDEQTVSGMKFTVADVDTSAPDFERILGQVDTDVLGNYAHHLTVLSEPAAGKIRNLGDLEDFVAKAKTALPRTLRFLPCVREFTLQIRLPFYKVEQITAPGELFPRHFFEPEIITLPPTSGTPRVSLLVWKELYRASQLYSAKPAQIRDKEITKALALTWQNKVTLRATPSVAMKAWCGLEVSTHSAGKFDYVAAREHVEKSRRAALDADGVHRR